jgi:hypothetical protein
LRDDPALCVVCIQKVCVRQRVDGRRHAVVRVIGILRQRPQCVAERDQVPRCIVSVLQSARQRIRQGDQPAGCIVSECENAPGRIGYRGQPSAAVVGQGLPVAIAVRNGEQPARRGEIVLGLILEGERKRVVPVLLKRVEQAASLRSEGAARSWIIEVLVAVSLLDTCHASPAVHRKRDVVGMRPRVTHRAAVGVLAVVVSCEDKTQSPARHGEVGECAVVVSGGGIHRLGDGAVATSARSGCAQVDGGWLNSHCGVGAIESERSTSTKGLDLRCRRCVPRYYVEADGVGARRSISSTEGGSAARV